MAESARISRHWWGRRRAALGVSVVVLALIAGGAAAWAAESSGNSGFRTTAVVNASVSNDIALVGTVEPVSNASAAFQVGGKVTAVSATVGEKVTVGQTLATLDTTALSEAVSSDQSTLASDQAKLIEDEDSETSSATNTNTNTKTTTTTAPTHSTSTSNPSGSSSPDTATITADQNTLTSDEAQTATDQQQEAADLTQAESTCGVGSGSGSPTKTPSTSTTTSTTTSSTTTTTATPTNTSACTTALQQVNTDEQQVSTDEATVAKDETNLSKALGDSGSGSSPGGTTGGTGSGTPGGVNSHALSNGTPSGSSDNSSPSGGTGSAASDSPEQIATDQANIDTAQANLVEDQQSQAQATLTSPIDGTVASVGIGTGDTVSAGSSTAVIVIIGTQSFEVESTLSSGQVPNVKVGQPAEIEIDGKSDPNNGTVSQVGPVESTSDGYSYPVVATLPASVQGLFAGSTANMTITTGGVHDVVAVPTSAVITNASTHYVDMLKNGTIARHVVKIGMVGSTYTQITSGLHVGQSVVLADLAEAVPSSNTATLGGLGGGGGFPGGGTFQRVGRGGPGGVVSVNIAP